jgi:hypothetical protein
MKGRIFLIFLFILFFGQGFASTYQYNGSGNWSVLANWVVYVTPTTTVPATTIPIASDDVIIASGSTVTLSDNRNVRSLLVRGTMIFNNGKIGVSNYLYVPGVFISNGSGQSDKITGIVSVSGSSLEGIDGASSPAVGSNSAFPVSLSSFNSKIESKIVSLIWTTELEREFDLFHIERSTDSKSFEVIGRQNGGNSNYVFEDFSAKIGYNYYRLKMIDLNGSYEYSKIIAVNFEGENTLVVYPNPPTNGVFNISGLYESEEIELFRSNGQKLEFSKFQNNGSLQIIPKENTKDELLILKSNLNRTTRIIIH